MTAKIIDIDGYDYGEQPVVEDVTYRKVRKNVCRTISDAYGDARKTPYTRCVIVLGDEHGHVITSNGLTYGEQIGLLELAKLDVYRDMRK